MSIFYCIVLVFFIFCFVLGTDMEVTEGLHVERMLLNKIYKQIWQCRVQLCGYSILFKKKCILSLSDTNFLLLFSDETKLAPESQEDLEESSESEEDSLQNGETSTNKQVNSNAGECVTYFRLNHQLCR